MEFQNVFQEMLNVTAAPPAPPPNPAAAALQRVPVDHARRRTADAADVRQQEAEPEDKPQERQQLRGGIRTVQAVLYALQETERTEN